MAITVLLLGGCGDSTSPIHGQKNDLARARAQWLSKSSVRYRITEQLICFCGSDATRPAVVEVLRKAGVVAGATADENIVTVTDAESGQPAGEPRVSHARTVQSLFNLIDSSFSRRAASVSVTYDLELGYPRHIFIDFSLSVADEEVGYEVELRDTSSHAVPVRDADIRGTITAITGQSIRVEEKPSETTGSNKAIVTITAAARLLHADGSVASSAEFRVGQIVRVWFNGPVAESYPVQGVADVIVMEKEG